MSDENPYFPRHIRNQPLIAERQAILQREYGIGYRGVVRLCSHPDYKLEYETARETRHAAYAAWNMVRKTQGTTAAYQCPELRIYQQAEADQLKVIAALAKREFGIEITSVEHLQYLRNAMQDCAQIQRSGMSPN